MKLMFVTARWDPHDPDDGAGVNYNAYLALKQQVDEIIIAGPFSEELTLIERAIRKIGTWFTDKRLIKFYPSYVHRSNQVVQQMLAEHQPDVIFAKASIPLVSVKLNAPLLYMCDSTVKWTRENLPLFSGSGYWLMERWERQVIEKASHILTFSETNGDILKTYYKKPEQQVTVHPIPSSIPSDLCQFKPKEIGGDRPLNLLLVGKTYHGKGVDLAIEATRLLSVKGIPAQLRIVGQEGPSSDLVTFMGLYSKNDPVELEQYVKQYHWAHFLIFPSRFDAAGIVPSEAAGFGVPTITNAAGGLATTVADGVSGIVLKKHSPATAYADVLEHFWHDPQGYQRLCRSTYMRYKKELNWEVLGKQILKIVQQMLDSQPTG